MAKSSAITAPNLGLYLDRPAISIPPGGLQDGLNFRIQQGVLNNLNLGWSQDLGTFTLNGTVLLIASMHLRTGSDILIFGTATDLYKYSTAAGGSVVYITPIYNTGTASASGTAVTGTTTAWNSGTPVNVKVGDEISFGSNAVTNPSAVWYRVTAVNSDTSLTLATSAGTVANGPYTIRKKFTGSNTAIWQYDVFVNAQPASEDRIYLTNGVDPIVQWNGIANQATSLSSLNIIATTLVVYKNMLVVGNVVQSGTIKPTDILNSNVSNPEDFSTGLASQFKVAGTADQIMLLTKLGDYLIIYLKRLVIIANFIGDPLIFIFRVAVDGKGLQAIRAIARYPDYHEFLSSDTVYAFNGANAHPISNHIWREAIRISDPARVSLTFTVLDEHRGDYIWAMPLTTDSGAGITTAPPEVAFVEHYLETVPQGAERPHSKRSFPFSASGNYARQSTLTWDQISTAWQTNNFKWNDQFFAASFSQVIVGDKNGKIWALNGSQNAGSSALNSYVRFGRRPTVDGNNRGLLARVYPFATKLTTAMNVTARFSDFAVGAATINATASYDQSQPEGTYFAPIYRVGRYVDIEFGTTGPTQPWEISGYDVLVRPGGMR